MDRERLIAEALSVTKEGGRILFSTYFPRTWKDSLTWTETQAGAGLLGEIDDARTGHGTIVCKDGFRATTVAREDFARLFKGSELVPRTPEVVASSLVCVARKGSAVSRSGWNLTVLTLLISTDPRMRSPDGTAGPQVRSCMVGWEVEKIVHFEPHDLSKGGFVHFGFHDREGRHYLVEHRRHFVGLVGDDDRLEWTVAKEPVLVGVPNILAAPRTGPGRTAASHGRGGSDWQSDREFSAPVAYESAVRAVPRLIEPRARPAVRPYM